MAPTARRLRRAAFQVGLAGELVLEPVQIEHEEGVAAGGFEEGVIPLEHREALAVRSPLRASKSWRSESFLWSCAHARAEKSNSIAATTRTLPFLMPVKIQPRTRTALKLRNTWPPAVDGRNSAWG